jgi:hypothetical protein
LSTSFDLTIDFVGTQIVINQHNVVYLYAKMLATSNNGNIFDKELKNLYSIGVNASGALQVKVRDVSENDKSHNVSTDAFQNFFTNFNDLINNVKSWTSQFVSQEYHNVPVDSIRNFVFPDK